MSDTRPFVRLPETATVDPPAGGKIRAGSDDVLAPGALHCTESGVAFGPLYLGIPESGTCTVERVSFLPGTDEDGGWLFGAVAAGAAGERVRCQECHDDTHERPRGPAVSRRGMLTLAGALLAAAAVEPTRVAGDDEDLIALHVAEVDLEAVSDPVHVRVLDVVDEVLPPSTELLVDVEETRAGEIADPSEGVTLADGTEGTVRIYLRDSMGALARLFAWARSLFSRDDELVFRRSFPDNRNASDYDEEQFVRLTRHPAVVEPASEAPEEVIMTIGNTYIPHEDEGGNDAGAWAIFDDALIYEVGPDSPAVDEYEIRMRAGWIDRRQAR